MKELVLYIAQSLDGYIAKKDESIDWLLEYNDPSVTERYEKFLESVDTIVMGYSTYRQVIEELSVDNWPYSDLNVFVLTHRFLENPYGVTFIHGDIKDIIDQSKNVAKKNIWLVGGSSIIEQCMKSNLIDRYIITIIPTLLGDGIQLFKNINQTKKLNQIGTYTLKDCIEVEYINA